MQPPEDLLKDLNREQRLAVQSDKNTIVIIAGPGTGKTKTLVTRIAYLILHQKVDPSTILAITFTKKAAQEMQERLTALIGKEKAKKPFIGTFHAFAHKILVESGRTLNIISEEERKILLPQIRKELKITSHSVRDLDSAITLYKSGRRVSADVDINKFAVLYNQKLHERGLVDFDDILIQAYDLLKNNISLRKKLQKQFQYIHIDEFQDTNGIQYELIQLLYSAFLFVIGDPLQSIYSFRGADPKIFDRVKDDFPDTKEIALSVNYRSFKNIINVCSLLFPQSSPLRPFRSEEGSALSISTLNEYTEADWVLRRIEILVGGTDLIQAGNSVQHFSGKNQNIGFSDVAVIYRKHHLSNILEMRFEESGIPYQIVGDERHENYDPKSDRVTLLTMHASKGLEFKHVFICGFEEGIVPNVRDVSVESIEEEKRLLYVAMTRARDQLYLVSTRDRNKKSSEVSRFKQLIVSEFLQEIEDEETDRIKKRIEKQKIKKSQLRLF